MASRMTRKVEKLVGRERVCRVATVGDGVMPHCVPVCQVVDGGKIYFGSGDEAGKVKNLEATPHVCVTVDLYSDDWSQIKGVMVQGTVELIARGPRFRKIRDLLYAKYPHYRTDAALSPSDSVIVEVTPTHVFTWGLD
ncbi:MAG: pyridoxamine 5'-phosphate oxidase family protein [Candidatus Rokubacteria bacterium]|nr:pyridoxamine 5'-phosphate oxidase family protein [Candidatus Rokubacteria bacterium]